jgi:hypothetical protein
VSSAGWLRPPRRHRLWVSRRATELDGRAAAGGLITGPGRPVDGRAVGFALLPTDTASLDQVDLFCTLTGGRSRRAMSATCSSARPRMPDRRSGCTRTDFAILTPPSLSARASLSHHRGQLGHAGLAVTDRYLRDVAPADLIALGKSRWTWIERNL